MSFSSIVSQAFQRVNKNRKRLGQALIFPFIAIVIIDLLQGLEPSGSIAIVLNILSLMVNTLFAVIVHRVILIGEHAVPLYGLSRWTKRETSFLLHTLAFAFILLPFILVISFFPSGLLLLIPLIMCFCWLIARLSLIFPAIAIEHEYANFKAAWELSRGKNGFMLAVIFLIPVISIVVFYPLLLLPGTDALASILGTIVLVYELAILSVCYEYLTAQNKEHVLEI